MMPRTFHRVLATKTPRVLDRINRIYMILPPRRGVFGADYTVKKKTE